MIVKKWLDNFLYKHGFKLASGILDKTGTGKLWLIRDWMAYLSNKIDIDPGYLFILSGIGGFVAGVLYYVFNVPENSFGDCKRSDTNLEWCHGYKII